MKSTHSEELRIALIQPDTVWENKEDNLNHLTLQIDKLRDEHPVVDIIVMPEMFSTGFTMNPAPFAETMEGATIEWMREIAAENELVLCGSIILEEKNKYYNRFVFVKPNGDIDFYDKKHLFGYAGENENYSAGNKRVTLEYKGWKINPFVCYDLRFPVWCRNTNEADVMLFVANWPESRLAHWQKLLPARAIENQCFVVGVNRVGLDFNNYKYTGQSCAIDPLGNTITAMNDHAGYTLFKIEKAIISGIREKIPFWKDGDTFEIK
ncbi:MAG: amidohydrolase [Bacteroidia bacterium]